MRVVVGQRMAWAQPIDQVRLPTGEFIRANAVAHPALTGTFLVQEEGGPLRAVQRPGDVAGRVSTGLVAARRCVDDLPVTIETWRAIAAPPAANASRFAPSSSRRPVTRQAT
jgi:hypothetical protein